LKKKKTDKKCITTQETIKSTKFTVEDEKEVKYEKFLKKFQNNLMGQFNYHFVIANIKNIVLYLEENVPLETKVLVSEEEETKNTSQMRENYEIFMFYKFKAEEKKKVVMFDEEYKERRHHHGIDDSTIELENDYLMETREKRKEIVRDYKENLKIQKQKEKKLKGYERYTQSAKPIKKMTDNKDNNKEEEEEEEDFRGYQYVMRNMERSGKTMFFSSF
jgi:hypothetical protein